MQAIRAKEKGLARLEGAGGQGWFQHFSRVRLVGRPRYAAQQFTAVTPVTDPRLPVIPRLHFKFCFAQSFLPCLNHAALAETMQKRWVKSANQSVTCKKA